MRQPFFASFQRMPAVMLAVCCLVLSCCGYELDGFSTYRGRAHSVLGDGSETLKIDDVEHVTLYPWVPFYIRGVLRDEVHLRRLGQWVDEGKADYLISVSLPGFRERSSVSNSEDNTLLYTTTVQLEVVVKDGSSGAIVWRSGVITYFDRYETVDYENVVRDAIRQTIKKALDLMQQKF